MRVNLYRHFAPYMHSHIVRKKNQIVPQMKSHRSA